MTSKGPNAFRTISEAAEEVGVAQHVLRFWETKFVFVEPVKRAGGRRFYRPRDIEVLKAVRRLLHDQGLTLRGVEKLHKEQGLGALLGEALSATSDIIEPAGAPVATDATIHRLSRVVETLDEARRRLDATLQADVRS